VNPASDKPIGKILYKKGYLKLSQLEQALIEQMKGEYRPLGQVLLELGYITREQLDEVIALQAKQKEDVIY
jgi:hypothetical protein